MKEIPYSRWIDIIPTYVWDKMTRVEKLLLMELDKSYFQELEFKARIRSKKKKRYIQ